jgi:type IV secretion system protein VirB10
MRAYDFDAYGGKLYRVFEGTVLEGVVTNHIDGSMAGPILIMLTTTITRTIISSCSCPRAHG